MRRIVGAVALLFAVAATSGAADGPSNDEVRYIELAKLLNRPLLTLDKVPPTPPTEYVEDIGPDVSLPKPLATELQTKVSRLEAATVQSYHAESKLTQYSRALELVSKRWDAVKSYYEELRREYKTAQNNAKSTPTWSNIVAKIKRDLEIAEQTLKAVQFERDETIKNVDQTSTEVGFARRDAVLAAADLVAFKGKHVKQSPSPPRIPGSQILVMFDDGLPAQAMADVLTRFKLDVIGVRPQLDLFLVDATRAISGTPSETAAVSLRLVIDRLRQAPGVTAAAPNTSVSGSVVSRDATTACFAKTNSGRQYRWTWSDPTDPNVADGTYAQRMTRLPAAWNFNLAIPRRGVSRVRVGIVDVGFDMTHEDLVPPTRHTGSSATEDPHGTHVAGLIAARFDNLVGIDGYSPFAELVTMAPEPVTGVKAGDRPRLEIMRVLDGVFSVLQTGGNVRVVNLSVGYNWKKRNLNPTLTTHREDTIAHGKFFHRIAREYPDVIIVSAAGNDSDANAPLDAQWGSPVNWAAVNAVDGRIMENIIVVGSVDEAGAPVPSSNHGAMILAPGENILSLGGGEKGYLLMSGTSQAAPQVTGVVASMLAYNPRLTVSAVRQLLGLPAAGGPVQAAPRLNAFTAILAARPEGFSDVADVNHSGAVDELDVTEFKGALIESKRAPTAPRFTRYDLNGSGRVSMENDDRESIAGGLLSDIDVFIRGWPSTATKSAEDVRKELEGAQ